MTTLAPDAVAADLRELYLHLLKHALSDTIHRHTVSMAQKGMEMHLLTVTHPRLRGEDWPALAETMAGVQRLDNVQACIESVLADDVPGDLIETGVWRGGTTIFMRGVLKAHGVADRDVYVADSFAGLPPPDTTHYPQDAKMILHEIPYLAVELAEVQQNFQKYALLDEHVKFVKGFFRDTLPSLRGHCWSVVRLDGDMYESTMDGLVNLYPGLSVGGYVILDDYYHLPECRQAVDDYRARHQIHEEIRRVDNYSAFWRKTTLVAGVLNDPRAVRQTG